LELLDQADGEAVDGKVARWLKVRRGQLIGWVWAPLVDGERWPRAGGGAVGDKWVYSGPARGAGLVAAIRRSRGAMRLIRRPPPTLLPFLAGVLLGPILAGGDVLALPFGGPTATPVPTWTPAPPPTPSGTATREITATPSLTPAPSLAAAPP